MLQPLALKGEPGAGIRIDGAWKLAADDPRVMGLSALAVLPDGRLQALSDSGALVTFAKPGGSSQAAVSDRERAICEAATVLAVEPARFGDEHRRRLRDAGLDDEDIWDLAAITGFFALSNRMAHVTEMRPNDEFYTMGR